MTVTVEHASSHLAELLEQLPNGSITLTEADRPVAKIVVAEEGSETPRQCRLGTMRGSVLYIAPDFDAPLDDFKDSM